MREKILTIIDRSKRYWNTHMKFRIAVLSVICIILIILSCKSCTYDENESLSDNEMSGEITSEVTNSTSGGTGNDNTKTEEELSTSTADITIENEAYIKSLMTADKYEMFLKEIANIAAKRNVNKIKILDYTETDTNTGSAIFYISMDNGSIIYKLTYSFASDDYSIEITDYVKDNIEEFESKSEADFEESLSRARDEIESSINEIRETTPDVGG